MREIPSNFYPPVRTDSLSELLEEIPGSIRAPRSRSIPALHPSRVHRAAIGQGHELRAARGPEILVPSGGCFADAASLPAGALLGFERRLAGRVGCGGNAVSFGAAGLWEGPSAREPPPLQRPPRRVSAPTL